MADTIKRDKSGMWTEMPPSAKNRKPDVRQPIPAPEIGRASCRERV